MQTDKTERLKSLLELLSGGHIEKGMLVKALSYNSMTTFERDISCLRHDYKANISYDKNKKTYHLEQ